MKIGEFVKYNIHNIILYCEDDIEESSRLLDSAYCKNIFNLNWPFFAEISTVSLSNYKRYWSDCYAVGDRTFRVCNHWFEQQRVLFSDYLVSKGIIDREQISVWTEKLSTVEDSVETSRRKLTKNLSSRFKCIAIGDAQNAIVRVILSNLGRESVSKLDWINAKNYFNNRCAYCDKSEELGVDHAVPINRNSLGEHKIGNMIPSCKKCNDAKHYRDFRIFLHGDDERIDRITSYMKRNNYIPLGDNTDIKDIIEQSRKEISVLAHKYIATINTLLDENPLAG